MQISLLQGTTSGTAVFVETQTATTNANGLVSIEIGAGTATTGTFSEIDWATGPYFIKTEIDPAGGSNYTITGTQQMASVPYALYAKTSGNGQGPTGPQGADGLDGSNGTNGLSAYQVWIGLGNTGTETDFINSLTGPQGVAGSTGATGAVGTYIAGIGISISGDTISTTGAGNISNAPNLTGRNIIGFEFSDLWECPPGVTEIMVQLWGGAGGGGSGSIPGLCSPCFSCSPTSSVAVGRPGGSGGSGGYNQQLLNVTPGTVYMITIGSGGQGAAPVTVASGVCSGLNGNNGNSGNTTRFGSILLAEAGLGGSGGQYNYDLQINTAGVDGVSGSVVNYDNNSITTSYPNQSSDRSFIPAGYTQNPVFPSCCSIRGGRGSSGKNGPITGPVMGTPGVNGENGYCIISY
jgi:hypothetical protein